MFQLSIVSEENSCATIEVPVADLRAMLSDFHSSTEILPRIVSFVVLARFKQLKSTCKTRDDTADSGLNLQGTLQVVSQLRVENISEDKNVSSQLRGRYLNKYNEVQRPMQFKAMT